AGGGVGHRLGRRREGGGGGDDVGTCPDGEAPERGVKGGGARRHGERLGYAQQGGELLLEASSLRARGDPARAERVDDLGDLFLADRGAVIRQPGRRSRGGSIVLAPCRFGGRSHGRTVGAVAIVRTLGAATGPGPRGSASPCASSTPGHQPSACASGSFS